MTNQDTVFDLVKTLAFERSKLDEAKQKEQQLLDELNEYPLYQQYQKAFDARLAKQTRIDDLANDVRNHTLLIFEETGEKTFEWGDVRKSTQVKITDNDAVVQWCIERKMQELLKPDVKGIKDLAKSLPISGVTITEGHAARIKSDLSFLLAGDTDE